MRATVRNEWPASISAYEGRCTWIYYDTRGLPTTGVGNLIGGSEGLDTDGLSLPWRTEAGDYVRETTVMAEAARLKGLGLTGSGQVYARYATLFLDEDVVDWLLLRDTDTTWSALRTHFPNIEDWPADAQMALLNMGWWMGGNFTQGWPNLTAGLLREDFYTAALNSSTIQQSQRNPDNRCRFETATRVACAGLNRDILWNGDYGDATDPMYPKHPLGMGSALLTVNAADIAATIPTVPDPQGWYFQRWLKNATGGPFYTARLDGLIGPVTLTGFTAWAKKNGQKALRSQPVLQLLSNQADRMKVTDGSRAAYGVAGY